MSKYLDTMKQGVEAAGDKLTIIGATLIVEVVDREQVTASGIVLPDQARQQGRALKECIVLAVGSGYYDSETGEETSLDTKVGDTIYVEPAHVNLLSEFPIKDYKHNTIGVVNDGTVKFRFSPGGAEAFRKGTGVNG